MNLEKLAQDVGFLATGTSVVSALGLSAFYNSFTPSEFALVFSATLLTPLFTGAAAVCSLDYISKRKYQTKKIYTKNRGN